MSRVQRRGLEEPFATLHDMGSFFRQFVEVYEAFEMIKGKRITKPIIFMGKVETNIIELR